MHGLNPSMTCMEATKEEPCHGKKILMLIESWFLVNFPKLGTCLYIVIFWVNFAHYPKYFKEVSKL